jgi:hypothetical protein
LQRHSQRDIQQWPGEPYWSSSHQIPQPMTCHAYDSCHQAISVTLPTIIQHRMYPNSRNLKVWQ